MDNIYIYVHTYTYMCVCIQRKLFSRLTFAFQNEREKKRRKRKSEGKRKNTFVDRQHGNNGGYANTGVCTEYSSHDGKILSRYNHAFRAQIPFYQRRRNRSETTQKPVVNETAIARHRARSPHASRQRDLRRSCILSEEIFDWKTEEDWMADLSSHILS